MTRTLPNTFALVGCLHAFSCWLQGAPTTALVLVAATMVVFRCELLVLLAPMTLQVMRHVKNVKWYDVMWHVMTWCDMTPFPLLYISTSTTHHSHPLPPPTNPLPFLSLVISPPTQMLLAGEVPFVRTALVGIASSALALALTVGVDSFFWQTLVWPEGTYCSTRCRTSRWNGGCCRGIGISRERYQKPCMCVCPWPSSDW